MHIPKHVAIIMDGNGRWAKKRLLPRATGHAKGVVRVKQIVEHCAFIGIRYLTLFAFGRDNWERPQEEVSFLMNLLSEQLSKEFYKLHEKNVKIRFIGDKLRLPKALSNKIKDIELLTVNNTKLNLNIAVDYSGTYDIVQAVNRIILDKPHQEVTEETFNQYILSYPDPSPDLLIRTSGEYRLSNFILWQLAYTECYFTNQLWPDFDKKSLENAVEWFNSRERRFGKTSEQLKKE